MWTKKFNQVYEGVRVIDVWCAWSDVNNWPRWDSELEYCDMKGDFKQSEQFILKPKNGPKIKITLLEVVTYKKFVTGCRFLGATMALEHELNEAQEGIEITNTLSVQGLFSWLWTFLVAKKIAQSMLIQMDNLVEFVRNNNESNNI